VRGAIPSLPQYIFMVWRLIEHGAVLSQTQGQLYLTKQQLS